MTQEEGEKPSGDVASNEFDHSRGRPTKLEEIAIKRELRPYFEGGYSGHYTASKTGYDAKTVNRIFNQWYQEILDSENGDFLQRAKEQKMQTIIALDTQLDKLHEHQNMIDQALNAAIKLANWDMVEKFSKLKLKTIEIIGKFVSAKINLVNTPTYDIYMEIGKNGEKNGV